MRQPSFDVTVMAAMPVVPARYRRAAMVDPLDITHELRMVKSAVLYADHVALASWRVALVRAWLEVRRARDGGNSARVLELVTAITWATARAGVSTPVPFLRTLAEQEPDDLTPARVETALAPLLEVGDSLLEAAAAQPSWQELQEAESRGLLEVMPMGEITGFGFSREAAIAEYLALLRSHTSPERVATPMLDYSVAGAFEVGRQVGVIPDPLPTSATEVGLVAHYLGYLPAVGDASLEDIMQARVSLERPLHGFRSIMSEMSTSLQVVPASPGFASEADDVFRREISSRLEEVRSLSRERGFGNLLTSELAESQAGPVTKALIGVASASVAGLPALAQAAVGAVTLAADLVGGVLERRRELGDERSRQSLLWMYEVESRFGS